MLNQMKNSINTLEKEIGGIRKEQSKLEDLGQRSIS